MIILVCAVCIPSHRSNSFLHKAESLVLSSLKMEGGAQNCLIINKKFNHINIYMVNGLYSALISDYRPQNASHYI